VERAARNREAIQELDWRGFTMPLSTRIGILTSILLALSPVVASTSAQDEKPVPAAEVTIKGNVLCNRATDTKPWFWDPKDGDHTPVIYALEGTPAIAEEVRKIMESYPDRGLDVEDALRIQDQFTKHLKYFLSPGAIADKIHKDVEAGSRLLALSGTISEKDGKRWIKVTSYEPAKVKYPEKMLAPDQPFAAAGKEPLVLKIDDKLTLKCILLPSGRFLQGSPFYQRRYQDEYPHEVVLTRAFYMSEIPITREIFEAVMGKNPALSKGARFPVERVAFADILEFCRILSQKNGVTVRLPTDAEWEYAARAGTSNPCFTEKYKDQLSETGSRPNTTPVQTKKPSAWGLYDMLCGGWHVTGDYKADNVRVRQVDPRGPAANDSEVHRDATGRLHKTRGGWHYDHMRPSMHGAASDNGTIWEGGSPIFRVVVETGANSTNE
jgi:formylglycine-generating enzyme required for sulfatase activity